MIPPAAKLSRTHRGTASGRASRGRRHLRRDPNDRPGRRSQRGGCRKPGPVLVSGDGLTPGRTDSYETLAGAIPRNPPASTAEPRWLPRFNRCGTRRLKAETISRNRLSPREDPAVAGLRTMSPGGLEPSGSNVPGSVHGSGHAAHVLPVLSAAVGRVRFRQRLDDRGCLTDRRPDALLTGGRSNGPRLHPSRRQPPPRRAAHLRVAIRLPQLDRTDTLSRHRPQGVAFQPLALFVGDSQLAPARSIARSKAMRFSYCPQKRGRDPGRRRVPRCEHGGTARACARPVSLFDVCPRSGASHRAGGVSAPTAGR
jgi:hypothetical protein